MLDNKLCTKRIIYIVMVLFFIVIFFFTNDNVSCCDSGYYLILARKYNQEGFFSIAEPLRTYGYPLFLSFLTKFEHIISSKITIFLTQFTFYILSLCYLSNIFKDEKTLQKIVFYALLGFFYIYPYLTVSLTDALYMCVFLMCIYLLYLIKTEEKKYIYVFLLGFFLGLNIIVRPASVWTVFLIIFLFTNNRKGFFYRSLFLFFGFFIPTSVQIILNKIHFNQVTFFPSIDLGSNQIIWGINNLKYATFLGNMDDPRMFYPSSSLVNNIDSSLGMKFYLYYPLIGVKLLLLKLVGAFDFDLLFPYTHNFPGFITRFITSFPSLSLLYFGMVSCFYFLIKKIDLFINRFFPIVCFFVWCAFTLPTAIELRFTLPMLIVFLISSCIMFYNLYEKKDIGFFIKMMVGYIFVFPLLYSIALFIREQAPCYKIYG